MSVRELGRWWAGMAVCILLVSAARADTPWAQALTARALESGFLTRLPPKLSAAFTLAKPQDGSEVRQLLTHAPHRVRTFNVSVANHADLVIFDVDVRTNSSVAYLLSPDGALRKAVAYQHVDQERPLEAAEARAGFLTQKRYWTAYLRKPPAATAK
jgi:hypothetical protein